MDDREALVRNMETQLAQRWVGGDFDIVFFISLVC